MRARTLALILAGGCVRASAMQQIEAAHPGALYEVRVVGCVLPGESRRRFDRDGRAALLWARERVHNVRYYPCTAQIEAIEGERRSPVYRVTVDRNEGYREGALPDESG
jgi:hypothetical protein